MSTSGKSSIRKDKFSGIGNIFAEQDSKKAEFEKIVEQAEPVETVNQEEAAETANPKPEKGRGDKKKEASSKQPEPGLLFFKEKKPKFQTKSVYLSLENIDFIAKQSEHNNLSFSEVLNQIIDNFKANI